MLRKSGENSLLQIAVAKGNKNETDRGPTQIEGRCEHLIDGSDGTKKKVKLGNVKTESQIKIQRLEKELKKSVKSKDDLNEITRRYELYQQKNELKSKCRKFDEEHYLVSKNLDIFKEKNTVKNIWSATFNITISSQNL